MDFRDATSRLMQLGISLGEMADHMGASRSALNQARLSPESSGYRKPPEGWLEALGELARERGSNLSREGMQMWWATFPGSGAARLLREWLRNQAEKIQAGDLEGVRRAIREGWERHLDMGGMPDVVKQEVSREVGTALRALDHEPADTEGALEALTRADSLTRGG